MTYKSNGTKLTKRQVRDLRADLMKSAHMVCKRLIEAATGKKDTFECECGKQYDYFPNAPLEMTAPQVNASKTILSKVFPDISPEDFESATDEFSSSDGWDHVAQVIKNNQKAAREELSARGIDIEFTQPRLKAV